MKLKITFILLFISVLGYSQVTNEGTPATWGLQNPEDIAPVVMPAFDLASLQKEDKDNENRKDIPYRFGYEFVVDYNLQNSGKWTVLENGDRVWRIRFYSEGAKTMNFVLSDFYMPEGATLYLYDNEKSDLLGAYDSKQNNPERVLGTWLVKGQDVWLEYFEPKEKEGQGRLEIFKLIHGYRGADDFFKSTNDLNSSGDCHYDVNCTMGGIDGVKDVNKKSVALIILGSGVCTGAMVNNTSNDGTPYFLTANHCYVAVPNLSTWSFRFNWISSNPVCGTSGASGNGTNTHTISGASLKARRIESDFALLELNGSVPDSWDVVWAGWNRNTSVTAPVFCIHHPDGDIMKVSKDNAVPQSIQEIGFDPETQQQVVYSVWNVDEWDMGVTEGGSSGSPLFDSNGLIIGQLLGGDSQCMDTTEFGGDVYGRFNVSWGTGTSASSRLRDWLDPTNSNVMTLQAYAPNLSSPEVVAEELVSIYPNPSKDIFTVSMNNNYTALQYEVYNVLGKSVLTGSVTPSANTINLAGNPNGIYILKLTDNQSQKSLTYKIVKE